MFQLIIKTVGVDNNVLQLKKAIVSKLNNQLTLLQLGYPLKNSQVLQSAIDLVEFIEMCSPSKNYESAINSMINKLRLDFGK